MEWNSAQLGHFQLTFLATEKGEIALCLLAQAKKKFIALHTIKPENLAVNFN